MLSSPKCSKNWRKAAYLRGRLICNTVKIRSWSICFLTQIRSLSFLALFELLTAPRIATSDRFDKQSGYFKVVRTLNALYFKHAPGLRARIEMKESLKDMRKNRPNSSHSSFHTPVFLCLLWCSKQISIGKIPSGGSTLTQCVLGSLIPPNEMLSSLNTLSSLLRRNQSCL